MCYPVCGMVHIKEPFLSIEKSSPCGGSGFLPSPDYSMLLKPQCCNLKNTYTNTHKHTNRHIHTYTHTYIYIYTHTHTHTFIKPYIFM